MVLRGRFSALRRTGLRGGPLRSRKPHAMKLTLDIGSVEPAFADRKILQGVYIRIETGAVTGLLGSNGSANRV